MRFSINFYLFLLAELTPTDVGGIRFNAITDNPPQHVHMLYLTEWNADPPSELDPATTDASIKLQICDDISNSGVFAKYKLSPVVMNKVLPELEESKYSPIFRRIYRRSKVPQSPLYPHTYFNAYRSNEFETKIFALSHDLQSYVESGVKRRKEFAFVCLLRSQHSQHIVPFYVSKAYGFQHDDSRRVHRFVYLDTEEKVLMLAEESAEVYLRADFNVELHYQELRKRHHQPDGLPRDLLTEDPVGSLFFYKQSFRLCAKVLTSRYFKNEVLYPRYTPSFQFWKKRVTFRTEEGIKGAAGKSYFENVLLQCVARISEGKIEEYYVSRAYNPNHVFVYTVTSGRSFFDFTSTLYLEALCTNVSIVEEHYYLGSVEI